MFENYVVTALRNLVKYPTQSLINIVGMAVGLAASILILLYVQDEMSWDSWIEDSANIYRFETSFDMPGREHLSLTTSAGPLHGVVVDQIPEIDEIARIYPDQRTIRRGNGEVFFIDSVYVERNFFEIFNVELLVGDRTSVLADPNNLIISQSTAEQFFGDENPIGELLTFAGEDPMQVVGIFADLPQNTHMETDAIRLLSSDVLRDQPNVLEVWGSLNVYTYFTLEPGASIESVEAQIPDLITRNVAPIPVGGQMLDIASMMGITAVPISDIHLFNAGKRTYWTPPGDIQVVYAFSLVALAVLLIAVFNFMNLSTARSTLRAREVAIRKVMGASRSELVLQFLGESIFMTMVSMVVAIAFVELSLPFYNNILDRELVFPYLHDTNLLLTLSALVVVVGVFGGLYPAFYLSQFRPAATLKANQASQSGGSGGLRATLVVLQFAASIILIIASGVIFSQTQYAINTDKGFSEENVLVVTGIGQDSVRSARDGILSRLRLMPEVTAVSIASSLPTSVNASNTAVQLPGRSDEMPLIFEEYAIDFNYVDAMGLEILAGRALSADFGQDYARRDVAGEPLVPDTINVVINETAARALGLSSSAEAIGYRVQTGFFDGNTLSDVFVVGVVRDFHDRSLREPVRPLILYYDEFNQGRLIVRFEGAPGPFRRSVRNLWREMVPHKPFSASFLDDRVANQYSEELSQARILGAFSLLAVFVASLGLFGLAAFSAERRTKEIGIRKSLGASTSQIVRLLIWQFSTPVLFANLLAWPIAFVLMQGWLDQFVYRVDLNPLLFIGASVSALMISWLTVSLHAIRAGMTLPALAMRYE